MKMNRLLAALVLMISNLALADSIELRMGAGLPKLSQSAIYSLGYIKDLAPGYASRLDVGYWSDSQAGHKPSVFTAVSVGKIIGNEEEFHASLYMGVAFISSPDALLSTPMQFTESLSLCYDTGCVLFGHFSNTGYKKPNSGRDYPMFGYQWRF